MAAVQFLHHHFLRVKMDTSGGDSGLLADMFYFIGSFNLWQPRNSITWSVLSWHLLRQKKQKACYYTVEAGDSSIIGKCINIKLVNAPSAPFSPKL